MTGLMLDKRKKLETQHFIKKNERRRLRFVAEQNRYLRKKVKRKKALERGTKYNIGKKNKKLDELQAPKNRRDRQANDFIS